MVWPVDILVQYDRLIEWPYRELTNYILKKNRIFTGQERAPSYLCFVNELLMIFKIKYIHSGFTRFMVCFLNQVCYFYSEIIRTFYYWNIVFDSRIYIRSGNVLKLFDGSSIIRSRLMSTFNMIFYSTIRTAQSSVSIGRLFSISLMIKSTFTYDFYRWHLWTGSIL